MIVREVAVRSVINKSRLPGMDYAVNPYVGCPHKCLYCYASFMKRFTNHVEAWGDFVDVKRFPAIKNPGRYNGKRLFFGSVTDAYNPYEEQYGVTRDLLHQLVGGDAEIVIATKSPLVLRDVDLLKQFRKVTVAFSVNTLDERFRKDMDDASPILERLRAMTILYEEGIHTVCFVSPIFPGITRVSAIIEATRTFCHEYWVENLNLRGAYRQVVLNYIRERHPDLVPLYERIYVKGDKQHWVWLADRLSRFAKEEGICLKNYFYHEEIMKQ